METDERVDYIEHPATVLEVSPADHTVTVRIDREDGCGECPAARLCNVGAGKEDVLTVAELHPRDFRPGEKVVLKGTETLHRKAILLCTALPCLLLVGVMVLVFLLTGNQLAAALWGIGTVTVFYIVLYALRDRLRHQFSFTIMREGDRK